MLLKTLTNFLLFVMLSGCASVLPPVQEMSDARQALEAAREAQAEQFAQQRLRSAEDSMALATRSLDRRNYDEARMEAHVAKKLAIKARDEALAAQK